MNPWSELLPTSVEIDGAEYEIRSDYRAALDICAALDNPELDEKERAYVVLDIFYPAFENMPEAHYQEAVNRCMDFINGPGPKNLGKSPKVVDWTQDFPLIVGPVNRILGQEVRAAEYIHWHTFLAAYGEIGDCTFAQVVRIRDRKSRGKKLDKQDQEWYNRNRHLVDFERKYTSADEALLKEWGGT